MQHKYWTAFKSQMIFLYMAGTSAMYKRSEICSDSVEEQFQRWKRSLSNLPSPTFMQNGNMHKSFGCYYFVIVSLICKCEIFEF